MDAHENLWCVFSDAGGFWMLAKDFKIKTHKIPLLENRTPFNGYLKKFLFDNDDNIWCGTNKGLYRYNIPTNTMYAVKYDLINDEVMGSIWIKGMTWLNDGSMLFSTFAGLYHVTNVLHSPVVKPINFLPPGTYLGFDAVFQDKNNFIYVKTTNDTLYILSPIDNGKDYRLFKSLHLMPDVNYFFNEKNDPTIYIATNYGLYTY
jgi:hypothetical protein